MAETRKKNKGKRAREAAAKAAGVGAPPAVEGSAASEGAAAPAPEAPKPQEPAVAPKHHVLPPHVAEGDVFLETAQKTADKLRENWQIIAAALLVVLVATLFIALRVEAAKNRARAAWEALRQLEQAESASAEDLLRSAETFRGTSAEPFFLLRAADARFAKGARAEAMQLYERVAKEFGDNPVAAQLAGEGLAVAKAAASFDPEKAMGGKPRVEMAKDLPPLGAAAPEKPADAPAPAPAPAAPADAPATAPPG